MTNHKSGVRVMGMIIAVVVFLGITGTVAQDRLKGMPGYDQIAKMQPLISQAFVSGALRVVWANDGKSFAFARGG